MCRLIRHISLIRGFLFYKKSCKWCFAKQVCLLIGTALCTEQKDRIHENIFRQGTNSITTVDHKSISLV